VVIENAVSLDLTIIE